MSNRFLISVAAAALVAGTSLAGAQSVSPSGGQGGAGAGSGGSAPTAQSTAPSERGSTASPSNADHGAMPMNRNDAKGADTGTSQRAQDSTPGQKTGGMNSDNQGGRDSKAGNRAEDRNNASGNRNAETKGGNDAGRAQTTTGQAGAAGKLSSDQRSKITTVIRQHRVEPTTNINFSISVGTRVPRDVRFHALPAEIVTIYPDWRGYEFFMVRDQIVVVDPRSLEIIAVIDA